METHFCKDFAFTSKYPELEVPLQNIKEFIFTDNDSHKSNLVICAKHIQEPQTNLQLHSTETHIECYQISKDLESIDNFEELRNLDIKEIEGSREIQNTIPN
jgi:hypothetical protein